MEQTLKNLINAFAGESQARNRYTFYAKIAKKEGYEKIGQVFLTTAENEKEHAKRIFEHIQEIKGELGNHEEITFETTAPTTLGTTIENLKSAIAGENHEETEMYPEYADIAQKEGLPQIAKRLRAIALAEKHHKERYQEILKQLENHSILEKEEVVEWVCMECGYVHKGKHPPEKCPSCDHGKEFYELKSEKF